MPNHYFQFKQFTVQQEKAALKVSTDSCLFGAWVAEEVRSTNTGDRSPKSEVGSKKYEVGSTKYEGRAASHSVVPSTILDIGAGSGLLMLMLAQKCDASIDGIEIDDPSYIQAMENIEDSPWKDRLQLFHADVKQYKFSKKYDLIISNPPFYEGDLKPELAHRNVAMHDAGLKLDELLKIVAGNLAVDGRFAVLLPFHRAAYLITVAENAQFFLQKHMQVTQTPKHGFFRSMLLFSTTKAETRVEELTIKNENNQYSNEFMQLLKDYYLYL